MQAVSSFKAKQKANFVLASAVNVRNKNDCSSLKCYLVVDNFEMVRDY